MYIDLLLRLPNNLFQIIYLENLKKKLCEAEWWQQFNNDCL